MISNQEKSCESEAMRSFRSPVLQGIYTHEISSLRHFYFAELFQTHGPFTHSNPASPCLRDACSASNSRVAALAVLPVTSMEPNGAETPCNLKTAGQSALSLNPKPVTTNTRSHEPSPTSGFRKSLRLSWNQSGCYRMLIMSLVSKDTWSCFGRRTVEGLR